MAVEMEEVCLKGGLMEWSMKCNPYYLHLQAEMWCISNFLVQDGTAKERMERWLSLNIFDNKVYDFKSKYMYCNGNNEFLEQTWKMLGRFFLKQNVACFHFVLLKGLGCYLFIVKVMKHLYGVSIGKTQSLFFLVFFFVLNNLIYSVISYWTILFLFSQYFYDCDPDLPMVFFCHKVKTCWVHFKARYAKCQWNQRNIVINCSRKYSNFVAGALQEAVPRGIPPGYHPCLRLFSSTPCLHFLWPLVPTPTPAPPPIHGRMMHRCKAAWCNIPLAIEEVECCKAI